MVMPISFIDYLDTRKVFKGYKEPKASEMPSGSQTPDSRQDEKAERNEAGAQNGNGVVPSTAPSKFLRDKTFAWTLSNLAADGRSLKA